ncbi:hypothetical protein A7J15_09725 [Microbacterium sediminis]|uniref:T6SS immunity protein Tdi1 C-terminal domain-containing protein n=1 Tax=Microbacterium sediminis TaxID=904291 RepID=A0A1B9N856_9MICO|nr:hypothetical protein A7J15_09725 [Microbacterium sediminis]
MPYTVAGPVSQETIERFGHIVSIDLENVWKDEGQLITADGFIRAIDPAPLLPLMDQLLPAIPGAVPLFATAWGDLVVAHSDTPDHALAEKHKLTLVLFRFGFYRHFLNVPVLAFDLLVSEDTQVGPLARDFHGRGVAYADAVAALGVPEIDECFGFVLPLSAGGANEVSNLTRRRLVEHLAFLVQMGGPPRDLDELDPPKTAPDPDDLPERVPTPAESQLIEQGSALLLKVNPTEDFDFRPLPEFGAVYVWQRGFGTGQIIVAPGDEVLYGNSMLSDAQLIELWRQGRRTPIEKFDVRR